MAFDADQRKRHVWFRELLDQRLIGDQLYDHPSNTAQARAVAS
jgi:hypothetical protein